MWQTGIRWSATGDSGLLRGVELTYVCTWFALCMTHLQLFQPSTRDQIYVTLPLSSAKHRYQLAYGSDSRPQSADSGAGTKRTPDMAAGIRRNWSRPGPDRSRALSAANYNRPVPSPSGRMTSAPGLAAALSCRAVMGLGPMCGSPTRVRGSCRCRSCGSE